MRIYEYAREAKCSSRDVLEVLKKAGFSALTHMSLLTDEMKKALQKHADGSQKENTSGRPMTTQTAKLKPKKTGSTRSNTSNRSRPSKRGGRRFGPKKEVPVPVIPTEIIIHGDMPLHEVADAMGKTSGELIMALMQHGMMCNRNQLLSVETIVSLATEFGLDSVVPQKSDEVEDLKIGADGAGEPRWPVVVVMGHVDHGKTSLLDYVRKSSVAAREKGGITQHIGADSVETPHGKIVFLDTPGHAAFTQLRKRGAKITDIAILMVAADDGIMPQTIEAIECAKAAKLPLIVAINKIDKVNEAAIEKIKGQLAQHDLLPEDWGGKTICMPISALTGQGVEDLLEIIVLQAQMLELVANPKGPVRAYVLESKVEKGYGPVSTIIVLDGTLKEGDYFSCGDVTGKVRLLLNSAGDKVAEAGPAVPVRVVGFDKIATAGDLLQTTSYKAYLKHRSQKQKPSIPESQQVFSEEKEKTVNLIIKSDTYGTNEAVVAAILELAKKDKKAECTFKVIHSGVGDVSEGDVALAQDADASVIGMHVKTERNAAAFAKEHDIDIKHYSVIYRLLEDLQKLLKKHYKVEIIEKKVGEAEVRKVFDIKGLGVIAGSYVKSGIFVSKAKVRCLRNGVVMGEGVMTSLERNKKSVKEVHTGSEFGFIASGFSGWEVGDEVHCIVTETKKPT